MITLTECSLLIETPSRVRFLIDNPRECSLLNETAVRIGSRNKT
jgi:hypothetical protein